MAMKNKIKKKTTTEKVCEGRMTEQFCKSKGLTSSQ